MRKLFLFVCLSLIALSKGFCQQVMLNPEFGMSTESSLHIQKIILYDTCTVLEFEYRQTPGVSFSVPSGSYICDVSKPDKLYIKSAANVQIDQWVTVPASGGYHYQLYFPPLAKSVKTIDFGEDNDGGSWFIYDIRLDNENTKAETHGFYGNWFSENSGRLEYNFMDSVAVINAVCWKYTKINTLKKITEMELTDGTQNKKIYFKTGPKGKYFIGEDLNAMKSYVRAPILVKPVTTSPAQSSGAESPTSDAAIYKGYIKGFSSRYNMTTGQLIMNNALLGDQETVLIKIRNDGQFEVRVPILYPQIAMVRFPFYSGTVYLEPGRETFQLLNGKGDALFMGALAFENESLMRLDSLKPSYANAMQLTLEKTAEAFKAYYLSEYSNASQRIDKMVEIGFADAKMGDLVRKDLQLTFYELIMDYNMMKESYYRQKNNIPRGQREIPIEIKKLSLSYYDFAKSVDFDNPAYLSASNYYFFINRLMYNDAIRENLSKFPVREIKELLARSPVELSAADLDNLSKIDSIQRLTTIQGNDYKQYVRPILDKFETYVSKFLADYQRNMMSAFLVDSLGIKSALLQDIIKSEYCLREIVNNYKPYSQSQLDSVCGNISNSLVVSYIHYKNTEMLNKIEANKLKKGYTVNDTPVYDGNKIFTAIMEKYKGKVVYVDFWATWCGPCLSGIREIASLKEELAGEDVVFVYITGTTSPEGTWKNSIPDIQGEHFRLSGDEWNMLCQEFGITGIPHYALVGKSGEIINPKLGHLNNESLKKLLLSHLH